MNEVKGKIEITGEPPFVRKSFEYAELCAKELAELQRLQGRANVPKVLDFGERHIDMEYLWDINLADVLKVAEVKKSAELFIKETDRLLACLKGLYGALMRDGDFYILGSVGLGNFILRNGEYYKVGFKGVRKGEPREDIGELAAHVLLAENPLTPVKFQIAAEFMKRASAFFGESKRGVLDALAVSLNRQAKKKGRKLRVMEIVNRFVDKVVICPDSFKGTLTATEAAEIIRGKLAELLPQAKLLTMPIADGGEGSMDCFLKAVGGKKVAVRVTDANFNKVDGEYLVLPNGAAVVEMAAIAGLPVTKDKDPEKTTSYGVGEAIAAAAAEGRKIILALGGSATTDGGAGIAAALGVKFYDKGGEEFVPVGGTLKDIERIDASGAAAVDIECMCDVVNPLYGASGAAYVFAPQKGADKRAVERLDEGLRHYADKIKEHLAVDVGGLEGGGAAGGIAAGAYAFFGARLRSGIDTVLAAVDFAERVKGADIVITGEGCLDATSFAGKAVGGVYAAATAVGAPVAAICGVIDESITNIPKTGLKWAVCSNKTLLPLEMIIPTCKQDLANAAQEAVFNCKLY